MKRKPREDTRSQAYTLEGVFAAVAVLTALVFGLQVVDVGPWTSDTAQQTSDVETRAEDLLDAADENGALDEAVRCYPLGKQVFDGSNITDSNGDVTASRFEVMLNQTFDQQDYQYNIYFTYVSSNGTQDQRFVSSNRSAGDSGVIAPSDSAAVARRTITIFDGDYTMTTDRSGAAPRDCGKRGQQIRRLGEGLLTYGDVATNSRLYNIVEVRLVVW